MFTFKDYYRNTVHLSFEEEPFSKAPGHVWVICRYRGSWLLTDHGDRGYEFPGGKIEPMEKAEQAAVREVKEETGAIVEELSYIGQYKVLGKEKMIIKNIYFARIDKIEKQSTYYETKGPVLLKELPENIKKNQRYSFVMKDGVLTHSMKRLVQNGWITE
ncbi:MULTISPECIES: RNA deprotection pyrophosphohydrolase [Bacillus]|uniref:7,8-dihydro-8-oxoguanine-triphosphatase n=2 Tax=Bacillus TaxID=1386 RepID=A0A0M3R9V4_9BACI|nr:MULTISPECIES: nucleoside triphosphatase YtkD [Bacillus]ALC82092.1 7,8-dihydro-8-oxoguanine-triphosphatase [Bacillus gobiensis]MBP1083440.1 8-oxo-dGTP diphosphatase [Bacillus capparidis]MED1097872.1 nucleoside triphosphatase YtkD [Bacillus capparidis]